ncbi:MAG TPA: hypothetical protein VGP82_00615, partial [Ktedonobacterales bacterium]|nr:hypothetical protein [Ktedonobacterales bacterium]
MARAKERTARMRAVISPLLLSAQSQLRQTWTAVERMHAPQRLVDGLCRAGRLTGWWRHARRFNALGAWEVPIPATVTLTLWQARQTWRLLLLAGVGVLAAVVLACAVPLYTQVALTAGLRGTLSESQANSVIAFQADSRRLSTTIAAQKSVQYNGFMHSQLGGYLAENAEFFVETKGNTIISTDPSRSGDQMFLTGADMTRAASHAQLIQGRLPLKQSSDLEIAVTPSMVRNLRVSLGSVIPISFSYLSGNENGIMTPWTMRLQLHVVGIFTNPAGFDAYWLGRSFDPIRLGRFSSLRALMSNDTFLAMLTQLARSHQGSAAIFSGDGPTLTWQFYLAPPNISIDDLDNLTARLSLTQMGAASLVPRSTISSPANSDVGPIQLLGPALDAPGNPSVLSRFRDRMHVVQVPVGILLVEIVALALFFVSLVAGLLVDRAGPALALMGSRGARYRQMLGAVALQALALGVVALVFGPLLAVLLVLLLAGHLLPGAQADPLNIITAHPAQVIFGLFWITLVAVVCAVLTIAVTAGVSVSRDMLELRREAGRTRRRPLWQRLQL